MPTQNTSKVRTQIAAELEPTEFGFRIPAPPAGIVRVPVQPNPAWLGQPSDDVCVVGTV